MACPASCILPRVQTETEYSEAGSAVADFIAEARTVGRDKALERVDEEHRPFCEAIDLDAIPAGAESEVALAWDYRTEVGRVLGRKLSRQYPPTAPTELKGTADRIGVDGATVVVEDDKTGLKYRPARESWQLRALALYGARTVGASGARVAMAYRRDDGNAYYDRAEFDALDLADFASELRQLVGRIDRDARIFKAGGVPDLRPSEDTCRFCECVVYCPAHTALARSMLSDLCVVHDHLDALTAEQAADVWERVKMVRKLVLAVEEGVRQVARAIPGGIRLPSGKVLRETDTSREEVDAVIAGRVIVRLFGEKVANAAITTSTSKEGIERALREYLKTDQGQGRKLAPVKRDTLEAIRSAGGLQRTPSIGVREVKDR